MNGNVCISKKNTYIAFFVFFVFLIVVLSTLALRSNQANNSKASEIKQVVQSVLPTAAPPTESQINSAKLFKVSRNSAGDIELLGDLPQIAGTPKYAIYMKRADGSLVHIDTFIASMEELKYKLTNFWTPQTSVSVGDVKTSDFLLYETK